MGPTANWLGHLVLLVEKHLRELLSQAMGRRRYTYQLFCLRSPFLFSGPRRRFPSEVLVFSLLNQTRLCLSEFESSLALVTSRQVYIGQLVMIFHAD